MNNWRVQKLTLLRRNSAEMEQSINDSLEGGAVKTIGQR
jgi:hypothetical protein